MIDLSNHKKNDRGLLWRERSRDVRPCHDWSTNLGTIDEVPGREWDAPAKLHSNVRRASRLRSEDESRAEEARICNDRWCVWSDEL